MNRRVGCSELEQGHGRQTAGRRSRRVVPISPSVWTSHRLVGSTPGTACVFVPLESREKPPRGSASTVQRVVECGPRRTEYDGASIVMTRRGTSR